MSGASKYYLQEWKLQTMQQSESKIEDAGACVWSDVINILSSDPYLHCHKFLLRSTIDNKIMAMSCVSVSF